jgi:hypothetical protein
MSCHHTFEEDSMAKEPEDHDAAARKERVIFLVTKAELEGLKALEEKDGRPRSTILRRALVFYYPKIFKAATKFEEPEE